MYAIGGRKSHLRPCIVFKKPLKAPEITDSARLDNMLNLTCNPGSILYNLVVSYLYNLVVSYSFFYSHILGHAQIGKVKVDV